MVIKFGVLIACLGQASFLNFNQDENSKQLESKGLEKRLDSVIHCEEKNHLMVVYDKD